MKAKKGKIRKLKPPLLNVARLMGKWKPADDLLLIESILHLNNMNDVCHLVKFSERFSKKEIEERWHAILTDIPISKMIYNNIKKLHIDDVLRVKQLVPFNTSEDYLILNLDLHLTEREDEFFEKYLLDHRSVFHQSRTSSHIRDQYQKMKKLGLLRDQLLNDIKNDHSVAQVARKCLASDFNSLEANLDDERIDKCVELDRGVEQDMHAEYQLIQKQVKRAEADLLLWQMLNENFNSENKSTTVVSSFLDQDTLAVLYSSKFNFVIKNQEVTIGRAQHTEATDHMDLSPYIDVEMTRKVSRKQCSITYQASVDKFFLLNHGKQPVYIDGKVISSQQKTQLYDKSIIEIGDLSILFLVNHSSQSKSASHLILDRN